jgi:hypothetical protein
MSSPEVRAAVKDRMEISWEHTGTYDIEPDITNKHIDRGDDDSPWAAIEFPGGTEDQISVGSPDDNIFRESGIFNVYVLVESGSGTGVALPLLESIRKLFRGKEFAGVECHSADPATTTDKISPATIQGQWYIMGTTIEYEYDRRG